MFDIGWSEMMVIAILALIVIGPKDLPRVLKSVAYWVRKARSLAREFQSGVDEMIREADLDDAKKLLDGSGNMNVNRLVEDTIDPTGSLKEEARDLEAAAHAPVPDSSQTKRTAASHEAPDDGEASAKAEPPKATVINHPVQVAPPHSLTPPAEEDDGVAEPDLPEDDTQKRA